MKVKFAAVPALLLFMPCVIGLVNAATLNYWIESPDIANVIYTENSAKDVEIFFSGSFDFSPINGNTENFSGIFLYKNGTPPFSLSSSGGVVHAFYLATPINFNIFGNSLNPIDSVIYLYDGIGSYNDGFYFQVTLDYSNRMGIQIPDTNYGLISLGLNAGAYPPNALTGYEVPRNFNVMEKNTGQASFWAEVKPIPIPPALLLLGSGLVGLMVVRRRRQR